MYGFTYHLYMSISEIKKVFSHLGFALQCPVCSTRYNLKNVKIIESYEEKQDGSLFVCVHSDCQKCSSSVMFNIDIFGSEIYSMGMLTDLTHEDSKKFQKFDSITADDCIVVHESLQDFNGDFIGQINSKN